MLQRRMSETKKSSDIPVTQKMLNDKVQEINHKVTSVSLEVKKVDTKVDAVDKKVDAVKSELKAEIDTLRLEVKSGNEMILSELRKMSASNEEMNSRNKYVLDGYAVLTERQDRFETEVRSELKDIRNIISDKGHSPN